VTSFQNAKPTSNFSFSTKFFDLTWIPIYTLDTKKFIVRSLNGYPKHQIIDTLNCKIFGQDHITIVVKLKRKIQLVTFLNQSGNQEIYITKIKNRKKIKETIEYLETNLQ
jgi:ethanolamine utilization protein EutP (predicted NTPase)